MIWRPRSLLGRLLGLVLGLLTVVWLGTAVITWVDVRHELDELLDSHLAQAAALLVAQESRELGEDEHDDEVDAPLLHRYAPKVAFQVFHEGRLTLRSAGAPTTPLLGKDSALGLQTVRIEGRAWRVFAAQGAHSDVHVYVGEQIDSRASILKAVLRSVLWPLAVALPLLALAAGWAVYRGLRPLRRLGVQLAERSPLALQPVALDDAPSEMLPMVDALNGLFERIGTLMQSERRFTADAAHELRTPVAAIRAQAQVALAEADQGLRRHALLATLEGCDRAARLIEQLLTLSRLESGAEMPQARVDLTALVRRTLADLAPRALDKRQTLELDAAEGCNVAGDETLLGVLVRNLVDNAIRYSPPSARVQIGLEPLDGGVSLRVEDSGPGLADGDRSRLGERFFRVLGSEESGSGLGWSIVRRIAGAHGAGVEVARSDALGGLRVDVRWPRR